MSIEPIDIDLHAQQIAADVFPFIQEERERLKGKVKEVFNMGRVSVLHELELARRKKEEGE